MQINHISNSKQNFGMAYLSYGIQRLAKDAKLESPSRISEINEILERLYDVYPGSELMTNYGAVSIFKALFRKKINTVENVFLDGDLVCRIEYNGNEPTCVERLNSIVSKLEEEYKKNLDIQA